MEVIFDDEDMAAHYDEGFAHGYEAALTDRELSDLHEDCEDTLP